MQPILRSLIETITSFIAQQCIGHVQRLAQQLDRVIQQWRNVGILVPFPYTYHEQRETFSLSVYNTHITK